MTYREDISAKLREIGENVWVCVVYEATPEGIVLTYYGPVSDDQRATIKALLGEPWGSSLLSPESVDLAGEVPFVLLKNDRWDS